MSALARLQAVPGCDITCSHHISPGSHYLGVFTSSAVSATCRHYLSVVAVHLLCVITYKYYLSVVTVHLLSVITCSYYLSVVTVHYLSGISALVEYNHCVT